MASHLHIVASCAERKRGTLDAALRLRAHDGHSIDARFERWWETVCRAEGEKRAAADLYVGPYWATVRHLPDVARAASVEPQLWVASAGYGLVPADAPLLPYSATFIAGHADSMVPSGSRQAAELRRAWWASFGATRGPADGRPRRIADLARDQPNAVLLIIASTTYIEAMQLDLIEAAAELATPENLILVTGEPGPTDASLQRCWLPSVSVLTHHVGGALPALHARVARRVLAEAPSHGLHGPTLRSRWIALAEACPASQIPRRDSASDDAVKEFIRSAFRGSVRPSHTPLLRSYRNGGRACEQSRFKRLFHEVAKEYMT